MHSFPKVFISRSRTKRFVALGICGSLISSGFLYSLRAVPILEQTSSNNNRDSPALLPAVSNGNLLDKVSVSLIGGVRFSRACATLAVIVVDYKIAFLRRDLSQWFHDISCKFAITSSSDSNSQSSSTSSSESSAARNNTSSSSSSTSESSSNSLHAVHLRSARRLLRLCQTNGGGFIKVGQHIAALDYMLPPE